jgi:D-psicose/D-tagatose/L-ribulose 3-epimerase
MNPEERSFREPLLDAGDRLFHLQVCGNDRGAPGGDLSPWDDIFDALVDIHDEGLLGIESLPRTTAASPPPHRFGGRWHHLRTNLR